MAELTKAQREKKVLETVRAWLPEVTEKGVVIQIKAAEKDGALFTVIKTHPFGLSERD